MQGDYNNGNDDSLWNDSGVDGLRFPGYARLNPVRDWSSKFPTVMGIFGGRDCFAFPRKSTPSSYYDLLGTPRISSSLHPC